jgi:TP901-1 family phage major tail protein
MAGQRGRDVLLKVGDGALPENFATVAGLRATRIGLNARLIDATSIDSEQAWRHLIAGGVKSASITGSGVFKDAQSDQMVRAHFFDQSLRNWRIIIPSFAQFEGAFVIETLDYAGEFDGEATFSMTLASAGVLSFTAI